jgi:dihydropteroate synthase
MARLGLFHALGCGVLLGASRKSFIAHLSGGAEPQARGAGSIAAALFGLSQGVQLVRVHDVAETRQANAVWQALAAGS